MSETTQTSPEAAGPATFTLTITARGGVRKAIEAASRDDLRSALVDGLLDGLGEDDEAASEQPEQLWKRAIVAKSAEGAESTPVEERYVLGVVMEPGTEDTHGERISAE